MPLIRGAEKLVKLLAKVEAFVTDQVTRKPNKNEFDPK